MVYSTSFGVVFTGGSIGGLWCLVLVGVGGLWCLVLVGVGGLMVSIGGCCRVFVGIGWRAGSIFVVRHRVVVVLMVGWG